MNTETFTDPPAEQLPPTRRRRIVLWVALAVAIPLLLAGFGLWWFVLRDDAPEAVSLDQAVAGVSAPTTVPGSAATTSGSTPAATTSPVSGTWTVDTSITNADGTTSFGGFRVEEQLVGVGANTAVGRSSSVEGTVTIEGTRVSAAQITVNLQAIRTNDSRRNNAVQNALATSRFPNATFKLTEPISVGSLPAEGQKISVKATGELTIRGVTKPATIDMEAQVQNGVLVIVGSAPVSFPDYNISAPTAPIVASVDNHGTIEFQLYLTKG